MGTLVKDFNGKTLIWRIFGFLQGIFKED